MILWIYACVCVLVRPTPPNQIKSEKDVAARMRSTHTETAYEKESDPDRMNLLQLRAP